MRWRIDLLAFLLAMLATMGSYAAIPANERAVLVALYTAADGPNWMIRTNWNGAPGTECSWYGITCNVTQTNVIQIALPSNNLRGALPGTLSSLTALEDFQVNDNQLTSTIPSLAGMTALRLFRVSNNQLTGVLPTLSGLSSLSLFLAHNNQIGGTIPSLSGLTSLRGFAVSDNRLIGSIPPLAGLVSLESFQVHGNQLTGSIPSLSGLTALRFFRVENNQLTGVVPPAPSPSALVVDGSALCPNPLTVSVDAAWDAATPGAVWSTGCAAPVSASERSVLIALYNSANGDSWINRSNWLGAVGTECAWFGVVCDGTNTQILEVRLPSNNLVGALPTGLNQLAALRHLDVSDNQLTGSIPSLAGMGSLLTFRAERNQLSGAIPSLSGLNALIEFRANNNQLSGPIPSLEGLGEDLRVFSVHGNRLTGTIPSLEGLSALQIFRVENNQLTGAIPSVPAPTNSLLPEQSALCPNALTISADPAWDVATPGARWSSACAAAAPIEATAVPTLGSYALLALGMLVLVLGVTAARVRRV